MINEEVARLDEAIGQQLALVSRTAPACAACGETGGSHARCTAACTAPPGLAERIDEPRATPPPGPA